MNSHSGPRHLLQKAAIAAATLFVPVIIEAQTSTSHPATPPAANPPAIPQEQPAAKPWSLEPIVIWAQKRPEDVQKIPESITALTEQFIRDGDITNILGASKYAPDVTISHFDNRRLSFPYIRGVGSGENNPAVTTIIDGVPALSYRTSNIEFLDIHDVDFIRGPQGTLYGRNSMGGVININSNPPSNKLSLESTTTVGNFQYYDERATVNLPLIKDVLSVRLSGGISARNGYTKNDVTGNDVDRKEAEFGKLQVWFSPSEQFDFTLRLNTERDRDGDYPLFDLASIRARPWHVSHAFEGNSLRDVAGSSLTANYYTEYVTFTSVTGFQDWRSQDITGLDYSTTNFAQRHNREHENDFTQELRASSPKDRPLIINDQVRLAWVAGLFGFSSDYQQNAVNNLFIGPPFTQIGTAGNVHQYGLGTFGQATLTFFDKLDLIAGARYDTERDHANITPFTNFGPITNFNPSNTYDNYSTRFGLAYHWTPDLMTYASAAQGYKGGGYNTSPSAPQLAFTPDTSWTYEGGAKSTWLNKRVTLNLDYFYVDWRNMQLDIPLPDGSAYVANAGRAHSQGLEAEASGHVTDNWDVFAGAAYMQSQFDTANPATHAKRGNDLPFAPDFTWNVGSEYSLKLCKSAKAYVRAEEVGSGRYFYDAANGAAQGCYAMTNFRLGVRGNHWQAEGWVENAFEAHTVPMAFQYNSPSGYIGESGIPRLYGVTLRIDF